MKDFLSKQLGSLVGLGILILLVYSNDASKIIVGLPFFMAAVILCLQSVILSRSRPSIMSSSLSARKTEATGLALAALQFFIVGFLNTSLADSRGSYVQVGIDLILSLLFLVACYFSAAIADDDQRRGGYKPVYFMGFPRSRRLIMSIFGVYCTFFPVAIMTSIFSLSNNPRIPVALKAADMSILMVFILSCINLLLVRTRYRKSTVRSSKLNLAAIVIVASVIVSVFGIRWTLGGDNYSLILSAATITIIALSTVMLIKGQRDSFD